MSDTYQSNEPEAICPSPLALCEDFAVIEDPRREQAKRHPLVGILVMALCSIAGGADGWEDIADTVELHFDWFKRVVPVGKVPPSADTFRRVIQALKPSSLQSALESWLRRSALEHRPGRQICFDGKTLRGSKKVHIVNAYDPEDSVTLGHISVQKKKNEISAVPPLIDALDLQDTICTGDAMFTQKKIISSLIGAGADYFLALKGNKKKLFEATQKEFAGRYSCLLSTQTLEKNRGWVEERTILYGDRICRLEGSKGWAELKGVVELCSERRKGEEFSIETRYFVTSLEPDLPTLMRVARQHWGIENGLHRTLDVFFKEDSCQVRHAVGAENLSFLRKLAGNILHKLDPDKTMKSKMNVMIRSETFPTRLLQGD